MESLGDILKKKTTPESTSLESTDISSNTDEVCPICKGIGYLRVDFPVGHPEFGTGKMVPCECRLREMEETKIENLRALGNLSSLSHLTFDTFIQEGLDTQDKGKGQAKAAYESARAYSENPSGWLVFSGVSGCGKTHLAAAIANHCVSQGQSVYFAIVPDLLDHLRSTFGPNSEISYDQLFEYVRNVSLLILDDLGGFSSSPWAQEKLFQIVNHRYNLKLPTVFTLSCTLKQLDERFQTRLTDPRLSHVVEVKEGRSPVFERIGSLGLELLSKMTFEDFDLRKHELEREQRENLAQAYKLAWNFAENPEGWIVFLGTHGCGKTHLAAAIGNYQKTIGRPALFVVVPDFLDYLRSTFSPDSKVGYDEVFESIRTTPLLLLDDLGAQTSTPWAQEKLYQVINYRYNAQLPTVITSNLSLDEIERRLASRMTDHRLSTVFGLEVPDFRGDATMPEKKKEPVSQPPEMAKSRAARGFKRGSGGKEANYR